MGRNDGRRFQNNHGGHHHNQRNQHQKNRQYGNSNNTQRAPRPNIPYLSLKENQIGITEYVTPSEGFTGIIKQRISDFHVNEIGFDGNICKLNDFSLPKPTKNEAETPKNPDDFIKLVSQETFDKLTALESADKKCSDEVLIDVTAMEKVERTQIHHTIKEMFSHVTSSTVDKDDKKFIKVSKQDRKNDRRSKWIWPHEYTYFQLHKENIDTMQAVSSLAPLLNGARASAITYAGTKDKRAKTTQWACIRRREPSLVVRAAQRLRNIFVGNFMFRDQPLKLGQLEGNRFRIALRQIKANDENITDILKKFEENGFINYYGTQRFGNHASVPTHQIGLFLLQGDFKTACEWILKPRENDVPEMKAVRENWWSKRDASEALKLLQRHDRGGRGIEYKLLAGFAKNGPADYVNSLENIPRNTRLMYIHAYQSLIWNELVSRRLAKFGLVLCEGDLVYADSEQTNAEILDDDIECDEENAETNENDDQQQQISTNPSRFLTMVKPLTKEDIESNKYTIFDIVLPLPGHDITYPNNECKDWYQNRLQQDDLSSEKLRQKQKVYSLTGAYRKVLIKPKEFNWHFMNYNTEQDTLIRSDVEELRGVSEPVSIEGGTQKALILEFNLPSSTYATMALREILKCDTSVTNQIELQKSTAISEPTKRPNESNDNQDSNVDAKKAKIDDTEETTEN